MIFGKETYIVNRAGFPEKKIRAATSYKAVKASLGPAEEFTGQVSAYRENYPRTEQSFNVHKDKEEFTVRVQL